MLEALEVLNRSFKSFLDQGDPRVKNWPMMQSPFAGLAMIVAYIYFVKVAGPQFMKKRKPYDLRKSMAVYNFLLVLINFYIFMSLGWYGYFNGYSLKCQPVDYSNRYEAVRMAEIGYIFYLTKFIEFADTIFFVLRKKSNQISALHVIHHSIVPFSLWFGIKFAPGGYNALFPFLNSFVHVIMYSYYGLSALGDKYKKYLFWKKYMTYLQLAQFVGVIIYAISLWYNQCDISKTFIVMNFVHALLFFGLFLNFFVKNYTLKHSQKKSPVLKIKQEAAELLLPKKEVTHKNDGNTHLRQLVSELEREMDLHKAKLHASAGDACCHLRCGNSHNGGINRCMQGTSYNTFNGLAGNMKAKEMLKDL